ncbi:MAG TPA: hypothetical protein VGX94_09495 [Terriglobia bacterium]|nr:hypothetical protein [Terriglobia bacterium]
MPTEIVGLRFAERLLASTSIPLLLWIGYKLFVLGVTGQMTITGTYKKAWSVKLTQVAPGTFCFLLGVILAMYTLHANVVHYGKDQTIQSAQSTIPQRPAPTGAKSESAPLSPDASQYVPQQTAQTKTQLIVDYLNGPGQWPLSLRLRYALSEMEICKLSLPPMAAAADSTSCEQKYYGHFSHVPKVSDISRIENEEKASTSGSAAAAKALRDEASAFEVHQ